MGPDQSPSEGMGALPALLLPTEPCLILHYVNKVVKYTSSVYVS